MGVIKFTRVVASASLVKLLVEVQWLHAPLIEFVHICNHALQRLPTGPRILPKHRSEVWVLTLLLYGPRTLTKPEFFLCRPGARENDRIHLLNIF